MDIKLLDADEVKQTFHVKGVNYTYMNAIRRLMKNRVPTMAIKEIEVVENSSAMYDEMLALRLGLSVMKTDLKSYNLPEKCKCKGEGCARCELKMTLNETGPKTVYAEDLKSSDSGVVPVHGKTPIVKLLDGQDLKLEATACLGYGKQHIKHSPGLMFYRGYPKIRIGAGVKNAKAVADVCPRKVFDVAGGKLKTVDATKCILCKSCTELDENVTVQGAEDEFIMVVEPWGQLDVKDMVEQAVVELDDDIADFEKELKKIK